MNKYKPLIFALVFVLCAAISFGVVKTVKSGSSAGDDSEVVAENTGNGSEAASSGSDVVDSKAAGAADNAGVAAVKAAEDAAKAEEAAAKAEEQAAAQAEATAKAAEEAARKAEANRMSASDFQRVLASSDASILGGKNPKVAKNISFSFTGMHDGDRRPGDVVAIRQKILMDQWASFTVVSVGYDAAGKINSAVIRPTYAE